MFKKIAFGFLAVVILFLGFVAMKPSSFHYEKVSVIKAPPESVYPIISQLRQGNQWTPWEKMDPEMKKAFSGVDGQPGSMLEFQGGKQTGSGKIEITKTVPNELVELKLTMLAPIKAENNIVYKLKPVEGGTEFTWTMDGTNGFIAKLFTTFIDCDKMMNEQFTIGMNNLKAVTETKAATNTEDTKEQE